MAARTSTKTVTSPPQAVDVDDDGDIDAVVSHTATVTIEEECVDPVEEPEPIDPSAGIPGQCGSNPCHQRTAVTFTDTNAGRVYTFTPAQDSNMVWNFGDGTLDVVGRGPVTHTFAAAGPFTVRAVPLWSARLKPGTRVVTVA